MRPPVLAEIVWSGLPTEEIGDAEVGGACGRFPATPAQVPFERTTAGGIAFPARLNGVDLRLALDSLADGPLAVSPDAAGKLGLSFARDVYGRSIGSGARIEIGAFSCAGIHVEALRAPPGDVDGILGGTLFREAVVELDPDARRLTIFDPARWVIPSGFTRIIVDDDGDRPVTTVHRGSERARLVVGTAARSDLLLAPDAASRLGVPATGIAHGLRWTFRASPPARAIRPGARTAPSGSLFSFVSTATSTCPTGGSTSGRPGSNRTAGTPFAPSVSREETGMLKLALLFLVIGLVAALFGFTAIAGASFAIAKFFAFLFLVLFLIFLILGLTAARKIVT